MLALPSCLARRPFGVSGTVGLRKVKPYAIGDQYIEHPPQQMRTPASSDRIEDDDHRRVERCFRTKPFACHYSMSFLWKFNNLIDIFNTDDENHLRHRILTSPPQQAQYLLAAKQRRGINLEMNVAT